MTNPRTLRKQGKCEQAEAVKRVVIKRQLLRLGYPVPECIRYNLHNLRICRQQVYSILGGQSGSAPALPFIPLGLVVGIVWIVTHAAVIGAVTSFLK